MKQNIEINKQEITQISTLIKKKFRLKEGIDIKINSNPVNYQRLNELIEIDSGKKADSGKKVKWRKSWE